mgnify:CR=1 FL=1
MNLNKNIVLVGMMGSGKSTIGYFLSKSTDLIFVDVDKAIEKKTGLKIIDIFEKKGEVYFRNLEEKITLNLLKEEKKILSLGGGAFLNSSIRKEISSLVKKYKQQIQKIWRWAYFNSKFKRTL